ncbi:MAG: hypothetical protein HPY64_16545 [Anaerolineae bacterium]|nr:hypothetical protein [Anaerolineae bacterium]
MTNGWVMLALFLAGAFTALALAALISRWQAGKQAATAQVGAEPPVVGADIAALRQSLQALHDALIRHSALVAQLPTSFTVRTGDSNTALLNDIRREQDEHAAALRALGTSLAALEARLDKAIARLEAARPAPGPAARPVGTGPIITRLRDVRGIGPVYERRLWQAGITTLAQLAALTPEEVRAIVQPPGGFRTDVESWIEQARQQTGAAHPPGLDNQG